MKLTSLLKESIAKDIWNKMSPDSREEILLGFVKNPDAAEKMVMMVWDRLPDSISGNKDFETAVTKAKNLKEADFTASQGYGSDYYNTKSDIMEAWSTFKDVEEDLSKFLEATYEMSGPDTLKDVINSMVKAINKAKPLINK